MYKRQAPLIAVETVATGNPTDRWQGRRHSPQMSALAASFDAEPMSEHTASALYWVLRLSLIHI